MNNAIVLTIIVRKIKATFSIEDAILSYQVTVVTVFKTGRGRTASVT